MEDNKLAQSYCDLDNLAFVRNVKSLLVSPIGYTCRNLTTL